METSNKNMEIKMNEKSNEDIWREEFEAWATSQGETFFNYDGTGYANDSQEIMWRSYLAARKKAQEEIERLEKRLIDKQNNHDLYYVMMEEKFTTLRAENEKLCDEMIGYKAAVDKLKEKELEALKKELWQQRFNNKHNLSIDQKISDELERLKKENETLIAERSQFDISYRELIELRKENERLKEENSEMRRGTYAKKLRDLLERAKPWVESYVIAYPFNDPKKNDWLKEYSEVMK